MKRWVKHVYRIVTRRRQRLRSGTPAQPILINSIPKAGTHLLKNIVLAIPGTCFKADLAETAVQPTGAARLAFLQPRLY